MTTTDQSTDRRIEEPHSIEAVLCALLMTGDFGASNSALHEKLLSLERKLASDQLHVAVLGQMKRGKSSFINALLGADVLPTGVLPVTAVITEIKYGSTPDAAILYTTGLRETIDLGTLADYITEAGNPGNKRQVASVELAYPSSFLETGIVLIDTPGIGSTHAHNTRTTEGYLEQVDAAIVVFSVDPPITEVESEFLRRIKEEMPKLFFILNKTDAVSADEVSHISRFLEVELSRLQIGSPEIFPLSARRALRERNQVSGAVAPSGMEFFERRLQTFLSQERRQVLVRSVALDALHIARTLKFALAIGVRAQAMSPDELHHKRLALDRLLDRTESEMLELKMLLRQHSANIVARAESDLTAQVEVSVPTVRRQLKLFQSQHPNETGRAFGTLLEDFLMQQVEAVFRRWRVREDEEIQSLLDVLSARFVAQANASLERLQQAAGLLFEIPVEQVSIACPLRVQSHLSYKVERVFHSLDSFLLFLPRFLLRPLVLRKMNAKMWQLLDMNAGRIRYDYVERLQASMTQFDEDLSAAVGFVTEGLKSALRRPNASAQQETAVLECAITSCSQLLL
jgi:GTP-binding protein EngB required for normal cell division